MNPPALGNQSNRSVDVISIVLSGIGLLCALLATACYFYLESEKHGPNYNNSQIIGNSLIWLLQLGVSVVGKLVGGTFSLIGCVLGTIGIALRPNKTAIAGLLLGLVAILILGSVQVLG